MCSSLTSFIEGGINLPSLEILKLSLCLNLGNFPQILGEMGEVKSLGLTHTGVRELPESIEKLVELQCLDVSGSRRLHKIHVSSILKLTKLVSFRTKNCGLLKKFKGPFLDDVSSKNLSITRLLLNENGIRDELLVKIISCFTTDHLEVLDLRENEFQVLPECLKDCHNLKREYVDHCSKLREIRGIPPNLQVFSAWNCLRLSSHSAKLLLSQVFVFSLG